MIWHPSPNFGPRRNGQTPSLVVLHFTEMTSARAALTRLCDPQAEVSAHYLIGRDGTLWQLVRDADRAWHAGAGAWRGRDDVNSRSLGIELDNDGHSPFSAPLMQSLESLLRDLFNRHSLTPAAVIAHSDMAPTRKVDPGPRFDWQRLARQSLALWPTRLGDPVQSLAQNLDTIGYPPAPAEDRLRAFRHRFAPGHDGPECAADRALAQAVAEIYQTIEK